MAARLWDKGETIDAVMHELTVGDDPQCDKHLVTFDAIGSAAHAKMLAECGYLSREDLAKLLSELKEIHSLGEKDEFSIPPALEDVHTTIENRLVDRVGEAGRRIHTARSRNDQVLLALRLYMRATVLDALSQLERVSLAFAQRFDELKDIEMPGYTHMQPAMPSSFGMWLHSYFEALLECQREGLHIYELLDSQPLGSGAGFGSSLKINRDYTAKVLKFSRVQRSFIDVNNSRGRYELRCVRWLTECAAIAEKFACDCMLYLTKEFGFISLPERLTTGSSIMPQKRNPDIVELLRGRSARLRGAVAELESLTMKLPSSYHRDLQYSKAPLIRAFGESSAIMRMILLVVESFSVNTDKVAACLHPELYATYDANREVAAGRAFRDAYIATAQRVKAGQIDVEQGRKEFSLPQQDTIQAMSQATVESKQIASQAERLRSTLAALQREIFLP